MKSILKRKNKKGFTLMEMLIVIGIIAILVAIAIPTFSSAQKKAQYAADIANVRAWYAEQLVANMTDDTELPPAGSIKDKIKPQLTNSTIEVKYIDASTGKAGTEKDPEDFTVIYTPATDDQTKTIKKVNFPEKNIEK